MYTAKEKCQQKMLATLAIMFLAYLAGMSFSIVAGLRAIVDNQRQELSIISESRDDLNTETCHDLNHTKQQFESCMNDSSSTYSYNN